MAYNYSWTTEERRAYAKGIEKGRAQVASEMGITPPRTNDERTDAVTERLDKIIDLLRPVPPAPAQEFQTRYVNRYQNGPGTQLFETEGAARSAAKDHGWQTYGPYLHTVAVKVPRV